LRVSVILPSLAAVALGSAPVALAAGGAGVGSASFGSARSGGAGIQVASTRSTPSHPTVPGTVAKIIHGVAYAPAIAPLAVQQAIWAGNKIRKKPYVYGGGHGTFADIGYDCSGTVSYVLHAAGLLNTTMDSSEFMTWGRSGRGRWFTVYTNPGHAFIEIAGIRLDTSAEGDPNAGSGSGPRWRPRLQDTSGFDARHLRSY
jgi:hypothetical protein